MVHAQHASGTAGAGSPVGTKTVVISGASGMVGSALREALDLRGDRVLRLGRAAATAKDQASWDPAAGRIEADRLEGADSFVHLAGENIASKRWNARRKQELRDSRIEGTRLIAETIARLKQKPRVLVSASAIGYYGNRGDAMLGEDARPGEGFLADLCRDWEAATKPAVEAGVRVVTLRIGVVLSPRGGALKKMLLPFRLGAGGRMGSGGQYWSWISLEDLVGSILHCLDHQELSGPVNAVAPESLTNSDFTAVLAKAVRRPAIFPMPAFAARLVLGEMAQELLLASARVAPLKLQESGYKFHHPTLDVALKSML